MSMYFKFLETFWWEIILNQLKIWNLAQICYTLLLIIALEMIKYMRKESETKFIIISVLLTIWNIGHLIKLILEWSKNTLSKVILCSVCFIANINLDFYYIINKLWRFRLINEFLKKTLCFDNFQLLTFNEINLFCYFKE